MKRRYSSLQLRECVSICFGKEAPDAASHTHSLMNLLLSISKHTNCNHERRIAEVISLSLPWPRKAIDICDVGKRQHLECKRFKVMLKNEVLCFGLLTTRVRIGHTLHPSIRCDPARAMTSRGHWVLIPLSSAKESPSRFRPHPAPLFEEECAPRGLALFLNLKRP